MNIHSLRFENFRNYPRMEVDLESPIVVLSGPNGAGKTNFLEAISFLSPGRGLRFLSASGINVRNNEGWSVWANLSFAGEPYTLSTGIPSGKTHRVFFLDGEPLNSSEKASLFFTCLWTTPHMERLFSSGASARRKFLDSLILAEQRTYSRELLSLERMLTSRNKILAETPSELAWLEGVEDSIARHTVSISAIRKNFLERIKIYLNIFTNMPLLNLGVNCWVAEQLENYSALEVEDMLREKLSLSRQRDQELKKTSWGAHKTDFIVFYGNKAQSADMCSSGEQKMILLTLILAQAENLKRRTGMIPTLLLDEPLVHLDTRNKNIFLKNIQDLNLPTFLTGTDHIDFSELKESADFLSINSGEISFK
ncbi:DNA replication/repair protein RecF [Acetobacteraceae bacterium]|nr:DNA replication/repair protein RecF [Acetobacteraceae bacterium]